MNATKSPMDFAKAQVSNLTIEYTLLHIARRPIVFQAARGFLKPEHFSQSGETAHRTIWALILDHYEKFQELPTYTAISMRVLTTLEHTAGATGEDHDAANAILRWIYDERTNPDEEMCDSAALETLREILIDRDAGQQVRTAVLTAGAQRIHNLPALLEEARAKVEAISAIGRTSEDDETMPTTWAEVGRPRWPTGVDFIDRVMEGGAEPGDCNIIIGPTGTGKTTLSMQTACSMARLQEKVKNDGGEPGLIVFFSWEDGRRMLQVRAGCFAGRVHKDRLMNITSDSELSTKGNLREYEEQMYRAAGQREELLGEAERLEQVKPWLNKYLYFVDYQDPKNGGKGHVPELRQKLMAIQEKRGMPIRAVFIDWAGEMIRNYLIGQNRATDPGITSLELAGLVHRCKNEIAMPFNCTVWVPHQLAGRMCKLPPGRLPHHSEAQWCTSFADNAWYALCMGTKDEQHGVCQFVATKTRHSGGVPPTLLKVDGAFCRMVDVTKTFAVDKITNRICPRDDVDRFQDSVTPGQHSRPNGKFLDASMGDPLNG